MGFDVLPAIDVAGGRLARFTPGGPLALDAHGGDPLAAAAAFVDAGAAWLHVVDLDLAFEGIARNIEIVRRIAALGVRVQASGGVVTDADVEGFLEAGATRVVLGSGALGDRPLVARVVDAFTDRIAVGVEVEDDRIQPRGGAEADLPLDVTLAFLAGVGARRFVVTTVRRVGTLSGPDLPGLERVVAATACPVIASGGIAGIEDLRSIARTDGVEGAIVGRASLEGGLDLPAALVVGTD